MTESQRQFLDEFTDKWSKEERDEYTKKVLTWLGDVMVEVAKEPNLLRKKAIFERAFKNKKVIERVPIIFVYAVKPEFRKDVARILRAMSSLAKGFI